MNLRRLIQHCWLAVLLLAALRTGVCQKTTLAYKYFRLGSQQDLVTATRPGFALMGGGTDLDEAFAWMCERTGGGDFLVLRATGDDDYDPYIQGLTKRPGCKLNSVATLILPNREASAAPFVAETIRHAEAIFIAGGDQANYIRFWKDTPVQAEINAAIARGVPIGGTSAGLAVMGEWAYSAEGDKPDDPNLDAKTALADPMGPRVTPVHGFLEIPILKGIITDSHFVKRKRLGRLLAFLTRIETIDGDQQIRGLGIDEKTAVLLDSDGEAKVVGSGVVYFIQPDGPVPILSAGKPLTHAQFHAKVDSPGSSFNLNKGCCGSGSKTLTVEDGKLKLDQVAAE